MNKKILFLAIFCAPLIFMTGCLIDNVNLDSKTDNPNSSDNLKGQISKVPDSNVTLSSKNKIKLTMYLPDSEVSGYETKTLYVSTTTPVRDIVRKMLKQENILPGGVRLIDYKVTIDNNRVATIDFRIDPNSRQISSASSTEILVIRSLNETLTKNSQLNINKVELTENGQEIVF